MLSSQQDVNNLVIRFVIPVAGSIGAAFATIWFLQAANPLATLCLLLATILFLVAIVAPRVGLYLLFGACAFSDYIKRLLVNFGDLSFDQISLVLAVAPLIVVGLLTSLVTRRAFHQLKFERPDLVLGTVSAILATASFVITFRAGGTVLEAGKSAVNFGVFVGVSVVGIRAFRDDEDLENVIRNLLWIFLPAPLYAFWQLAFGFTNFEIEYLRSGLTIEVKQLYDIRPRPFSTLNSAGVLGTLSAGFLVLAIYPWLVRRYRAFKPKEATMSVVFSLIYFGGAIGSLVRSSHVVWIISGVCIFCFGSARRTRYFYIAAVAGLIGIIVGASWIQDHLEFIDPAQFATSDYGTSALTILTYNDRLNGFINMTSSWDMWSWFGIPPERQGVGSTFSHDPISTGLMKIGVIGVTAVIVCITLGLRWIHLKVLALPDGRRRLLAVVLTSLLVSWLWTEMLVNSVITVFPLNALFWLLVGAVGFLVNFRPDELPDDSLDRTTGDIRQPLWRPQGSLRGGESWDTSRRELPGEAPRR